MAPGSCTAGFGLPVSTWLWLISHPFLLTLLIPCDPTHSLIKTLLLNSLSKLGNSENNLHSLPLPPLSQHAHTPCLVTITLCASLAGVLGPAVAPSPRNLFQMQTLRSHPRMNETEMLEVGPASGFPHAPPVTLP